MRVLLADDNQDNLDMIGFLLKNNNFEVGTALNGKIALEMLRSEKYDLIISDILMPIMDGFMLCKECKQDEELKKVIFLFYTATYIDRKDEDLALSLGARRFIRKPQEPEAFLAIINEVIKQPNVTSPGFVNKEETEMLKLYSERLISKLEKKNLDLEGEVMAHKKTVEELIVAKEKAEESDKLKTAFLANMSHEIRTPLNTIIGFSKIIAQENLGNPAYEQMAMNIDFNSKVLIKIIEDIIDMSKMESDKFTINKEIVNVNEILVSALATGEIIKKDLLRTNVELRLNKNNENVCVLADKIRLVQIFNNLISNAFKFTEKGEIEVGYKVVDNAQVQFYVKDTGIGIHEEDIPKIFKRFYKANNDLTTIRGMGLGLTLSKDFIEKMNGEIHVVSEISKGSTFYFTLPYVKSESASPKLAINSALDLKDKLILIAEDDNGNFLLANSILKNAGAMVLRAVNGLEAVKICESNMDIDFVLMDIKMPLMDGIEATKIIKTKRNNLKIIAMSAFVFTGPRQNITSVGFDDFIPKPIDVNILLSVLKKV